MALHFNPEGGKKIIKMSRVHQADGTLVETARNEAGQAVKISVFMDKNGDGQYTADEVVSVKYIDVDSRSRGTTEYRDTDGDGYCDEVVESDWTGNENVKKVPDNEQTKMDLKYGFKWDAPEPVEPAIHMTPRTPLDRNGNPVHYN